MASLLKLMLVLPSSHHKAFLYKQCLPRKHFIHHILSAGRRREVLQKRWPLVSIKHGLLLPDVSADTHTHTHTHTHIITLPSVKSVCYQVSPRASSWLVTVCWRSFSSTDTDFFRIPQQIRCCSGLHERNTSLVKCAFTRGFLLFFSAIN